MSRWGILLVLALAGAVAACDRTESKHAQAQPQAVGTSGAAREAGDVSPALAGSPPAYVTPTKDGTRLWTLTRKFYEKRGNAPAWIENRKPARHMDELMDALQRADREGIDPALYNVQMLTAKRQEAGRGFLTMQGFDEEEARTLDVWLTYLYLQYASSLSDGVEGLSRADPGWKIRDKKMDALALLEQSLEQRRVGASLTELLPSHKQYTSLRDALAQYRQIAQQGGWPAVPATLKLKPGQQHAAVSTLAKRLSVTGDFPGTVDPKATTYGPDLQEAVKRFQRRHGLQDDAIVGATVVAQLNVPVERRIEQIALNLERWRWLPKELGERHVLVNVPEQRLEVWDRGQVPLSMRVIVGKKTTPTPIFTDDMTHIVFSPYWNVPPDIAANETVPSMIKDPAFLSRMNMEVLDKSGNAVDPGSVDLSNPGNYRIRQRPGASNALGYVKFMFPNQFNVYLHDTPTDSLFERASRSFSHGCVRVEQPEQLAQYVLADQPEWTTERIDAAMHAGVEKHVKLTAPVPVYLGYWTARVSADGVLQFRDDLYGIDATQSAMLTSALQTLKTHAAAATAEVSAGKTRR